MGSRTRRRRFNRLRSRTRWFHCNGPALLAIVSLACALMCLREIGEPPIVGLDALWVYERRLLVRVMLYAAVSAGAATALVVIVRRHRLILGLAWSAAIGLSVSAHRESLAVITQVLLDRMS